MFFADFMSKYYFKEFPMPLFKKDGTNQWRPILQLFSSLQLIDKKWYQIGKCSKTEHRRCDGIRIWVCGWKAGMIPLGYASLPF